MNRAKHLPLYFKRERCCVIKVRVENAARTFAAKTYNSLIAKPAGVRSNLAFDFGSYISQRISYTGESRDPINAQVWILRVGVRKMIE